MTDHRTPPGADAIRAGYGAHQTTHHGPRLGRGCRTCHSYRTALSLAALTALDAAATITPTPVPAGPARVTISACPTTQANPAPPNTADPTRPNANGT